ncbi:hypothetical protein GCM10023189_59290 [Nibrella saemangeumensis]|uniref:HEAT repeat-containing protein n=1 Tax=Nibrella saemangeumensis TaxID=1084526 RepID=A0ABP8NPJ9_9BACT
MKQDVEKLLEKYYNGETSLEEEKQLRQYFQRESVPAHLQAHAGPFRYFAEERNQQPSETVNTQLAAKLDEPVPVGRVIKFPAWTRQVAASVALLIVGFAGGLFYGEWQTRQTDAPAVALSGKVTNTTPTSTGHEIKQVLAFEQVETTSASERIQAVNQCTELDQADQEITQLLINTLNFDANVNVRLAACQALLRFESEPGVREALIQSLQIQTDPNIQITLIEALVAMKEKRAVNQMQQLLRNHEVLDIVRVKAEEGLNALSGSPNSVS